MYTSIAFPLLNMIATVWLLLESRTYRIEGMIDSGTPLKLTPLGPPLSVEVLVFKRFLVNFWWAWYCVIEQVSIQGHILDFSLLYRVEKLA